MYFPSTRGGELPKTIKSYRSARKLRSNPINEKKEKKRAEKRDGELREARPGPAPHSPLGGGRVELRGRYGGGQRSKQLPPPAPDYIFVFLSRFLLPPGCKAAPPFPHAPPVPSGPGASARPQPLTSPARPARTHCRGPAAALRPGATVRRRRRLPPALPPAEMMSDAGWVWKENNFQKCSSAACEGRGVSVRVCVCARPEREGRGEHGRNFTPPVSTPPPPAAGAVP